MAPETIKEVAKIAVETSGEFTSIWRWAVGTAGAGLGYLWLHITGRITKVEDKMVGKEAFEKHVKDEDIKFELLFEKHEKMDAKHDRILEKISVIGESVARIEGSLNGKK
mgnify:CR=1 FL=1